MVEAFRGRLHRCATDRVSALNEPREKAESRTHSGSNSIDRDYSFLLAFRHEGPLGGNLMQAVAVGLAVMISLGFLYTVIQLSHRWE